VDAKLTMFADDAMIVVESECIDEAVMIANKNLAIVDDWLKFNSMAINISKCSALIYNAIDSEKLKIRMGGENVAKVHALKYLGVYLDNQLNLTPHFENLVINLSKKIGLLGRLSHKMDDESREKFFKSLILPSIDYCSSYLLLLDEEKFSRLQKIVNKAMRIVLQCDSLTSIDEMCRRLNVLRVRDRIELNSLLFINKIIVNEEPRRLRLRCVRSGEVRERSLRNDLKYKLPAWNSNVSRRSLFYHTIDVLNKIKFTTELNYRNNCLNYIKSRN
jgi:hypothetical protein